ncbi:MAG: hypothetical protein SVW57_03365 [Thermodesulfobacteriota bacterium]|nr:hypothetical protein [Thermodesulfobacteriota bacterium]
MQKGLQKTYIVLSLVCLFSLTFRITPSYSKPERYLETLDVEGTGIIMNMDKSRARNDALKDCFRKAVRRVVELMFPPESLLSKQDILIDIINRAEQFVMSYRVLAEGEEENNLYLISIEATIMADSLKAKLVESGVFTQTPQLPKILLIIDEGIFEDSNKEFFRLSGEGIHNVTAAVLGSALERKGFTVQSLSASSSEIFTDNINKLREIGKENNAGLVIIGKAFAENLGRIISANALFFEAKTTIKAISVSSGDVILSLTGVGSGIHSDSSYAREKSLAKAAEALSENLAKEIFQTITIPEF